MFEISLPSTTNTEGYGSLTSWILICNSDRRGNVEGLSRYEKEFGLVNPDWHGRVIGVNKITSETVVRKSKRKKNNYLYLLLLNPRFENRSVVK